MKKKLRVVTALVGLLCILAACGADPRSQFLNQLAAVSETKNNATSVDISIAELDLSQKKSGDEDPMAGLLRSSIANVKMTVDYLTDLKTPENIKLDTRLSFMGNDLPLELLGQLGDQPKLYIGMEGLGSLYGLVQLFGGANLPEITDLDQLSDKYIDMMSIQGVRAKNPSKAELKRLEKYQEFAKASQKEWVNYMQTLDKKSFTKTDEIITHKFSKKELMAMMELTQKVAKADKKFADFVATDDTKISQVFQEFKELSVSLKLDTKTSNTEFQIVLAPTEKVSQQVGFNSLILDVVTKSSMSKERVNLPEQADLLTEAEIDRLAAQLKPTETAPITEAEFNELLEEARTINDTLTNEERKEALSNYRPYLTEKHYQKLEEVLK